MNPPAFPMTRACTQHLTQANVPKSTKNSISDELKLISLLLFCPGCAKWDESSGRWRGAGPAWVWSDGAGQELSLAAPGTTTLAWASPGLEPPKPGKALLRQGG